MKKTKKTALTAAVFAAAMGMTACAQSAPVSETESQPDVYYKPATEASTQKIESSKMLGDINGDNKLSVEDNIMLWRYLKNQQKLTYEQYQRADYNQDGLVNIFDSISQQKELIYGPDWVYRFTPQPDYGPPETIDITEGPTEPIPQPVYGPPEIFETTEPTETEYEPSEDFPVDVYGPPEWFDTTEVTETEYDPETEEQYDVYGPPAWFDETEPTETETETEPEAYCVYGPPVDWEE